MNRSGEGHGKEWRGAWLGVERGVVRSGEE